MAVELEDDDVIDVVGTIFLVDEDPEEEPLVGIDAEDEEFFVSEGDYEEDLRDYEGEMIRATGTLWVDDAGKSWLHLLSFELGEEE